MSEEVLAMDDAYGAGAPTGVGAPANAGVGARPGNAAEAALERLRAGNRAFVVAAHSDAPIDAPLRVRLATEGQNPYAVVLACSDSRVVPEHIFMAGLGELFCVRVAGNIAADTQVASVAYALGHFDTHLVVVLGHTSCGAVSATLAGGASGCVSVLTDAVGAAIGDTRESTLAACENVRAQVARLVAEPDIARLVDTGDVRITGALYHIDTGEVEWL